MKMEPTTYIYTRSDGVRVHQQAWMGHLGVEYEHPNEPNWLPPAGWPYQWVDMDKKQVTK